MQCFMKKEANSLIDVENVTTGERCCHLSSRTPLDSLWCTFIFHLHLCIYHTNVFEAENIKYPPPNVISPIFFAIFISLCGSTHDSADYWNAHRSPSVRDSLKRVHD